MPRACVTNKLIKLGIAVGAQIVSEFIVIDECLGDGGYSETLSQCFQVTLQQLCFLNSDSHFQEAQTPAAAIHGVCFLLG